MAEDREKVPNRRERRVSSRYRSTRVLFVALACLTLFGCGVYLGLTSFRRQVDPALQKNYTNPEAGSGVHGPASPDPTDSSSLDGTDLDGNDTGALIDGVPGTSGPSGTGTETNSTTSGSDSDGPTGTGGDTAETNEVAIETIATAPAEATAMATPKTTAMAAVDLNDLSWPASGEIRQEPGWYYSEKLGAWRYLPGVAISGDSGRDVCAALAGVVQAVFDDPVEGKGIVLSHGTGLETKYSGIRLALHIQGDQVKQGEVIARLQGTDLIFEVSRDGEAQNPANYLSQGR